jgi:hypothetical protein
VARLSTTIVIGAFRCVLLLYPSDFRERFGDCMACVFEESCHTAYKESGWGGFWVFLLEGLADVAIAATAERCTQVGSRIGITNRLSLGATLTIHTALFSILLWLGFHAPPVSPSFCGQKIKSSNAVLSVHASRSPESGR